MYCAKVHYLCDNQYVLKRVSTILLRIRTLSQELELERLYYGVRYLYCHLMNIWHAMGSGCTRHILVCMVSFQYK